MLINVYWNTKTGDILIPTVAKTEAGYWLDIEPVQRASANDLPSILRALQNELERDEIVVPTPTRLEFPKPVVLSYSNSKNWSSFLRQYTQRTIVRDDHGHIRIEAYAKSSDTQGMEVDLKRTKELPLGSTLESVATELMSSIQKEG